MTPYYQHGGITIYHGDCREIMPQLDLCDMAIADPPYGDTPIEWDRKVKGWTAAVGTALSLAGSLWVFGSFRYFFSSSAEFESWKFAQDIVWEKHNGSSFHADRFKRVHEYAVQFYREEWGKVYKRPVVTHDATARSVRRKQQRPAHLGWIEASSYSTKAGGPRLMRSVIYARSCHRRADHPTQKPVEILWPLIQYSLKPDGILLDPFMGSGSALVAAKALGARAVGIEIEERYCEIAAARLSQEVLNFSAVEETA